MPLVLDATVGGPTANSYLTVAAATTVLDGRLNSEPWDTPTIVDEVTSVEQARRRLAALVSATRLLDEAVDWYGMPTSPAQALAWPQTGQVDQYGQPMPSDSIPDVIQQATAFTALALLRDSSEAAGTAGLSGVASVRTGDGTQIVYRSQAAPPVPPLTVLPVEVRRMLTPYGTVSGSINVPLVRS
jgi:hypothetical protein